MPHPGQGRPTDYSLELAKKICDAIAAWDGSIDSLCAKSEGFPVRSTLYMWRDSYPDFSTMFWEAKRRQAATFAEAIMSHTEEMLAVARESEYDEAQDDQGKTIVNTEVLGRSKLRVDTLEKVIKTKSWMMARLEPKHWGTQKVEEEKTGETHEEILQGLK